MQMEEDLDQFITIFSLFYLAFLPTPATLADLAFLILWILIVIALCLLVCCRFPGLTNNSGNQGQDAPVNRSVGIGPEFIAFLPFYKFSPHGCSRLDPECSICLSKFEDMDALHMLPKCRHAFHVSCIDAWLEKHSSCPLCRQPVEAADVLNFVSVDCPLCCSGENMRESNEGITMVRDHGKAVTSDPGPSMPDVERSSSFEGSAAKATEHAFTIQV